MKKIISVMLAFALIFSVVNMLSSAVISAGANPKNYPLPKGYVVKTMNADFDATGEGSGDNAFYGKSKKILSVSGESTVLSNVKLDGVGYMFWYKSTGTSYLRIRKTTRTGSIIIECTLPAAPEGRWATYYYYGKCIGFTFKTDMSSDIRTKRTDDDVFYMNIMWMGSDVYLDEFFTFTPDITPADSYDNDEQAFKFSNAKSSKLNNTDYDYYDDGSVDLYSTQKDTAVSTVASLIYDMQPGQFKKAVDIAKKGSGFLQIKCDNISCVDSTPKEAYGKINLSFGGIGKTLTKYIYGSGTSDTYLINVKDIDAPESVTQLTVTISGTKLVNAKFRLSPITVYHFPDDEIIIQAEELVSKVKKSGVESDATIYTDADKNRSYVYSASQSASYVKFELPKLDVGEYYVYASCLATVNTNCLFDVAVNNLRQASDFLASDKTYSSQLHNVNIPIGNIKITKDYKYGASTLKFVTVPRKISTLYVDYFSFKRVGSATAEPESNFIIKPYPEMDDYEVLRVLDTYNEFIFGDDVRWYKENLIAGYVGNGTAYNLNSRCTYKTSNQGLSDSNCLWQGSDTNLLDGDGIRFWYKSSTGATLRFYHKSGSRIEYNISAMPTGGWVTVMYKNLSALDTSDLNKICMSCGGDEHCVDELHTIRQKVGSVKYALNGDGTASVVGYDLRLEDVVIDSTYMGCPVTTVKSGALANSYSLRSVKLPDSVTTIEENAFKGDKNLVTLETGNGLKTIGANAFSGCSKLGEISAPSSVTSIASNAFASCPAVILKVADGSYAKTYAKDNNINYHASNADYDYYCISHEIGIEKYIGKTAAVTIPQTIDSYPVTAVRDGAFKDNATVTSVTSQTLKTVGASAFAAMPNLKSAAFSSLVTLGDGAFMDDIMLDSVALGTKITTIGENAFANDKALANITLPASLSSIDGSAFANHDDDLVANVVKDSYAYKFVNEKETAIKQIPDTTSKFKYSLYRYEATVIGYTGEGGSINIPEQIDGYNVIAVGEDAFKNNKTITYVSFSDKCKRVYDSAFYGCSSLKNFDICNIVYLGELAFAYCTGLSDIRLTNIVQYEYNTFLGCDVNISIDQSQFSRSAMDLVNTWHGGINIGNRFDWAGDSTRKYIPDETARHNAIPKAVTKERIQFFKKSGYDVVRFPIAWYAFIDDSNNYTIDPYYLNTIKEIVDWAIDEDLYIIINVHHDTLYWLNLNNYGEEQIKKFERLWEQVADTFKDYDEHLIFESLNEERQGENWDGNGDGNWHGKFNDLQKRFYNVVRKSGGYNDVRYLMFETYGAQAKPNHCKSVWVPSVEEDDHVIMSLHHYDGRTGTQYYDTQFGYAKTYFQDNGIPCVIGETGAQRMNLYDKSHPYTQEQYDAENLKLYNWTDAMMTSADKYGVKVIIWEDNGSFGMINKNEFKWDFPLEVEAFMKHAYPQTSFKVSVDGAVIYDGEGSVILPKGTKPGFICYTDGKKYYAAGESIKPSADIVLVSVCIGEVQTKKSAALRMNDKQGIRFYTEVDISLVASLKAKGAAVEMGTLIALESSLGGAELTHDFKGNFGDVMFDYGVYYNEDAFCGVVGSIVNIKDNHITTPFVARGYVKVSIGGVSTVVYSSASASCSLKAAATDFRSMAKANPSSEYAAIYAANKALIDKWADA